MNTQKPKFNYDQILREAKQSLRHKYGNPTPRVIPKRCLVVPAELIVELIELATGPKAEPFHSIDEAKKWFGDAWPKDKKDISKAYWKPVTFTGIKEDTHPLQDLVVHTISRLSGEKLDQVGKLFNISRREIGDTDKDYRQTILAGMKAESAPEIKVDIGNRDVMIFERKADFADLQDFRINANGEMATPTSAQWHDPPNRFGTEIILEAMFCHCKQPASPREYVVTYQGKRIDCEKVSSEWCCDMYLVKLYCFAPYQLTRKPEPS